MSPTKIGGSGKSKIGGSGKSKVQAFPGEVYYVDPSYGGGGNNGTTTNPYTSLNAALAARCNKTFTLPIQIRCRTSGSVSDTTRATTASLGQMVPSENNPLQIVAETGHRAGRAWDATKYNLYVAFASGAGAGVALKPSQGYIFVDGLQIGCSSQVGQDASCEIIYWAQGTTGLLSNCLVRGTNDAGTGGQITRGISSIDGINVENCVFYDIGSATGSVCVKNHGNSNYYSSVFITNGSDFSVDITDGVCIAKNCYAGGSTSKDYQVGGTLTLTTCASSDLTGTAGLRSIPVSLATFVSITLGTGSYNLPGSSALIGVGTDTRSDGAPFNFTTDIVGTTRALPWSIGAYAAVGILAAPANIVATPGGGGTSFTATFDAVSGSVLRYEYRLDSTGSWTSNGTSTSISGSCTAAPHILNVRAVDTNSVPGTIGNSATFGSAVFPATNLIAFYKLDEASGSALDASGNSKTFTENSACAASTMSIGGSSIACRVIDAGGGKYFQRSDDASFDVGTGDFTVSCWIELDATMPNDAEGGVLSKKDNVGTEAGYITGMERFSNLAYTDRFDGIGNGTSAANLGEVSTGIAEATPFHAIWVFARSGSLTLYINNVSSTSVVISGVTGSLDNAITSYIGRLSNNSGGSTKAKFSYLGFWKKALDSTERTSLYNTGHVLAPP